jgi:type IV pilus assembly protein PilY1
MIIRSIFKAIAQLLCLFTATCALQTAWAQQPQAVPPNISSDSGKPMVMLNMSRDHQLFYRAYNEYTDVNFDGLPDTTYNHAISYYGYFDSFKCYNYSGVSGKFAPTSINTNKYCSGAWSGNFLNWATMTRVDVVRKVLYGGFRSADTASSTVLQRSYLPTDSHSFAKYYNGADLNQLTPYTAAELAPREVLVRGRQGNWATNANANYTQTMSGITICNTTLGANTGVNRRSQTNTNPPLMRVAFGDFSLWNANERWQCYWAEEGKNGNNGNQPSLTGLAAAPRDPHRNNYDVLTNPGPTTRTYAGLGMTSSGAGPDYIVRVDSCVSGLVGTERCRQYPDGNLKPFGLLQEFGETNAAEFALITGSYAKNISGGVLRKNMSTFRPEINHASNGTFTGADGIVKTLNSIRIFGYDYDDGTYRDIDSSGNWCSYQLIGLTDNQCTSWGNPLGEMMLESLQYLGGKSVTSAFDYTSSGSKDATLGLSQVSWVDPFLRANTTDRTAIEAEFGKAQCRAINILNFNASVISYDKDNTAGFSGLSSTSVNSLVDTIGAGEGINGSARFVGRVGGVGNNSCDAKTISSLADVDGLCPDAPAYRGSYSLAGLSYWAHTNKIRNDISTTEPKAFKADVYSVALSPGSPRIVVPSLSDSTKKVIIQPAYRLDLGGANIGGGTLVDFRIVTQTPNYGKYLIVWEDSEQGGDYDQDVSGILEYFVVGNQISVRTSVFAAATANPQGFGYVISGTSGKDGVHFHSGIIGFNFTDSTNITVTSTDATKLNVSGGCVNCQVNDPATTALYTIAGGSAQAIEDPMYYAAKWGGFNNPTNSSSATPSAATSWDNRLQDGSPGSDGVPDNYFVVYRPDLLENALRQVFTRIFEGANTAPAVSSAELRVGSLKYEAKYDPKDQRGQLDAFAVNANGSFGSSPTYRGDINLTAITPNLRQIVTNVGTSGIPFTEAALTAAGADLTLFSTNTSVVTAMFDYIRGGRANEEPFGERFRPRNVNSIMGAIINSTPWIQRRPGASYSGPLFPGFASFATAQKDRDQLLWVGANDGMLHGFKSADLTPVISYIPGLLGDRLKNTTDRNLSQATAYADGSPFTADVIVQGTSTWATYLFSSLGRSKPGIFALDVTNTGSLNQSNASSLFKWQYPATGTIDNDLGYITSTPARSPFVGQPTQVAKFRNGKFGVIFGNGAQSPSGKSVLYILFVTGPSGATGTWQATSDFIKIETPGGGSNNGLGQVVWSSDKNDNIADAIYAGDLRGNLWKFDVSGAATSSWGVAYSKPLYVLKNAAGNRLPVTTAPVFAFHPDGGRVVVAGTGKALNAGDYPNNLTKQRIYGIWDKPAYQADPTLIPDGLSELLLRPLTATAANSITVTGTQTSINWATYKGYYMELPITASAVITNPGLLPDGSGNAAFGLSVPEEGENTCSDPTSTNLLIFDPISGYVRQSVPLAGQNPSIIPDLTNNYNNSGGTPGPICTGPACPPPCTGPNCPPPPCPAGQVCNQTCECRDDNGNLLPPERCVRTVALTSKAGQQICTAPSFKRLQWREIPGILTGPQ